MNLQELKDLVNSAATSDAEMKRRSHVQRVECVGVEKRTQPNKHRVYVFEVTWDNLQKYSIYRPYTAFFDFKTSLKSNFKDRHDVNLPDLPGVKWFERGLLGSKDSKRKKKLDEYCLQVLKLPTDVVYSQPVLAFFEPWASDLEGKSQPSTPSDSKSDPLCASSQSDSKADTCAVSGSAAAAETKPQPSAPRAAPGNMGNSTSSSSNANSSVPSHLGQPILRQESEGEDATAGLSYVVEGNFKADNPEEVDLHRGEMVDVIRKDLSGWWFVQVEDRNIEGWAPACFLQPREGTAVDNTVSDSSSGTDTLERFRAIRDYDAVGPDEVSYKCGQEMDVIEVNMDGWWKVRLKEKEGFTPALNLQPIHDSLRRPGKSSRVAQSLYHHHSIYKRRSPPPRREAKRVEEPPVYAEVQKKNKQQHSSAAKPNGQSDASIQRKPTLTYAEIVFDDNDKGSNRPIIRKDSGVQYTEIIPMGLQQKTKAQTPVLPQAASSSSSSSSSSKGAHSGAGQNIQQPQSYENVQLNKNPDAKITAGDICVVTKDQLPKKSQDSLLKVKSGDLVKVEKLDKKKGALCQLCDAAGSSGAAHGRAAGWVPLDTLQHRPTPSTGAVGACGEDTDWPTEPPPLPSRPPGGLLDHGLDIVIPVNAPGALAMPSHESPLVKALPEEQHIVAVCSHSSIKEGVLSFKEHDAATLLSKSSKGWWLVRLHGVKGWVPAEYWKVKPTAKQASPEILPHQPELINVNTDLLRAGSTKSTTSSSSRQSHSHETKRWFVGGISRGECEALLTEQGNNQDFLIRESMHKAGDFTLSVKYGHRVRHFSIELTQDGKYYIGKHGFKNLCRVVSYYQSNALFYDAENTAVMLGMPFKASTC